jgi:protein O-GlcNAc transferase
MSSSNRIWALYVSIAVFLFPLVYLALKNHASSSPEKAQASLSVHTDTSNLPVADAQFENYLSLGLVFLNDKKWDESIRVFEGALKINPASAVALNNLGIAWCQKGDFNKGSVFFKQALDAKPDFQLAKNNLQWALTELGKSRTNKDSLHYFKLGTELYNSGKYAESIAAYTSYILLDPRNPFAFNNMGTCYMLLKKYSEATLNFEKAIALDPKEQLYSNNLAWAQGELKKKQSPAPIR